MQPIIRKEVPTDVSSIEAVTVAAFLDVAHTNHTEQHIVNALRRSGALTISLVAELDGVLVGHVALSPVRIGDGSTNWFGLGPISVLPAHQRRGVGSALMAAALAALRHRGAQGCVVLGDPGYYGRFGFRAILGQIQQHRVQIEDKPVTGCSRLQPEQTALFEALNLPIPRVENVS